jgi:hypothetical protein
MCGDSTDAADVQRLFSGEKASLLATDPPHLVDYDGGERAATKSNKGKTAKHWDDYTTRRPPSTSSRSSSRPCTTSSRRRRPTSGTPIRQHLVMQAW